MNKKYIAKKALKFTGKALKVAAGFSASILAHALENSSTQDDEPTLKEVAYGEKMPNSEKYFMPEEKYPK